MHSFSRSLLGLGALTLAGCGAPAELDESLFPDQNATGYTDGRTGGVGPAVAAGGSGAGRANGGVGGVATSPRGGSGGSVARGGSGAVATGGSGTVAAGGGGPASGGGLGSAGQQGGPPAGGTGQTGGGACPDISELFARPGAEGGCDGAACHVPGGTRPDLISPNVEQRLVNVISSCKGRPYIGPDDSFLEDKLVGNPPDCGGFAMPFGTPQALSADDEQCILDWIDEVSGG